MPKTKVEEQLDLVKEISREVQNLADIFSLIILGAHSEIPERNLVQYGRHTFHKDDEQMIMGLLGTVKGAKLVAYRNASIIAYNRFIIDFIFDDIQINPLNYKRLAPKFVQSLMQGELQ